MQGRQQIAYSQHIWLSNLLMKNLDSNLKWPDHYQAIFHETIKSTNDTAKEMAVKGAASGTVIYAAEQTKGRGRLGNQWISPAGNLYFSLLLRPEQLHAKDAGQYSFLAAVALHRLLAQYIPETCDIQLKWPNDILVDHKKISGILLEAETKADGMLEWLVIGIGVNLKYAPEEAASVKSLSNKNMDLHDFAKALSQEIESCYQEMKADGFEAIAKMWLSHAYRLGEEIKLRLPTGVEHGIFKGISKTGALIYQNEAGEKLTLSSGDVFF